MAKEILDMFDSEKPENREISLSLKWIIVAIIATAVVIIFSFLVGSFS